MSGFSNKGIAYFFSLRPTNIMKNSQPATGLSRRKIYNPQLEREVVKKHCNLMEDKFQGMKGELGVKIWGTVPVCGVGAAHC